MSIEIGKLSVQFGNHYLCWFVAWAVAIRLIMGALRTLQFQHPPTENLYKDQQQDKPVKLAGSFLRLWWEDISSTSDSARVKDYGTNFLLGLFELAVYPPLIAVMHLEPIGAWITLKTLAEWGEWKTHRGTFNRFLIGNALVLSAAIWLATMLHATLATSP